MDHWGHLSGNKQHDADRHEQRGERSPAEIRPVPGPGEVADVLPVLPVELLRLAPDLRRRAGGGREPRIVGALLRGREVRRALGATGQTARAFRRQPRLNTLPEIVRGGISPGGPPILSRRPAGAKRSVAGSGPRQSSGLIADGGNRPKTIWA